MRKSIWVPVQYVLELIGPDLLGTSSKRIFYIPPIGTATRDGTVAKLNGSETRNLGLESQLGVCSC